MTNQEKAEQLVDEEMAEYQNRLTTMCLLSSLR